MGNRVCRKSGPNDAAIGRMAANHLLERGFRRFGFCGFRGEAWSKRREEAFAEVVESHCDTECARYNSTWHGPTALSWEEEQERIVDWCVELSNRSR